MTKPQRRIALPALAGLALSVTAVAQSSNGGEKQEPTFDVVSIRRSGDQGPIGTQSRPDGLVMTRVLVNSLLQQAFPSAPYRVGLPEWAQTERYDVTAKSRPGISADERAAMVRALLADRFKLLAHVEDREQPVYELVVARSDGKLAQNLRPTPMDCDAFQAEQRAAADAARAAGRSPQVTRPSLDGPPQPCMLRFLTGRPEGDRIDGDGKMDVLAPLLASNTGREVLDKTGLSGFFRLELLFSRKASINPTFNSSPGDPPSIYTAVQEQLGLKLVSVTVSRPTLVIDRLERPTPN
jgi:uncharacterized protein (TIGR03435 family)